MPSKIDLSILLYIQTKQKVKDYTKKELLNLVNLKDIDSLEILKEYTGFKCDPDILKPFKEDNLKHYLQLKYKRTFPFCLTTFVGQKDALRKTILWWFNKYTDFNPDNIRLPSEDNLNFYQKSLIVNVKEMSEPRKTLLQIVNAGPGTGKTMAANSLAYSLKDEGVLLISYTNESVRENYKRFFEYPEGKDVAGFKKYENYLINLVTIDSLASKIIGEGFDKNFDETIQIANLRVDPLKFIHPIRRRLYNHIVVDECQDIDDLRGNFLLTFCQKIGIKSLTLCGDPRQKIRSNCGKWYSNLWEDLFDFEKNGHSKDNFSPILKIGFVETYRFTNEKMVKLVNSISEKRNTLHVPLKAQTLESYIPIEIISITKLTDINVFNYLLSNNTACIIGPSIEADNKTTNIGKRIASIFREKGKCISFKSEGAFQPDSIPFLSIHSSKGREFDIVFIFGMSNYPDSFPMIPNDEATSLLFVAHSRAKKKIYYIDGTDHGKFVVPLHIDSNFLDCKTYEGEINKPSLDFYKLNTQPMRHFNVTQLVEEHSFIKFLEENRYYVKPDNNRYETPKWKVVSRPKEISINNWGFILAFDFQSQLVGYEKTYNFYFGDIVYGSYVVLPEDQIVKDIFEGKIINNRRIKDNKRVFCQEIEEIDLKFIEKFKYKTSYAHILYLHCKYYCNEILNLHVLEIFFDGITKLCDQPQIVKALEGGEIEVSLSDKDLNVLHGRCDYQDSKMNIYEFKSTTNASLEYKTLLQTWLYHVMSGEENSYAYIYDLNKGHLYELSSDESIHRWRYIIKNYFILRHHVDLVTSRENYLLNYKEFKKDYVIPDNFYTVDTEFYNKEPFETAIVNVNDPFRTIVDLTKPSSMEGMLFALDWLPDTNICMYKSTLDKLRFKFNTSSKKVKEIPVLSYYIANTDVDWCNRKDIKKLDLCSKIRVISEPKGAFTSGNFGPKLGEIYTILAPFPLEYQPHLKAHNALSDSLMLYELIRLGIIKI